MRYMQIALYRFDELSDEAKEKARDWYRDGALDYEWWDGVFDVVKTAAGALGIEVEDIYFSGFSSQGDGAQFTGSYSYGKGWRAALEREFPPEHWKDLYEVGLCLQQAQRLAFYQLSARVAHSGHYNHEMCTAIDVYDDREQRDLYASDDDAESLRDALRDFMRWIYSRLEEEHDWLMSDEQVDESIRCNEYEFTEEGFWR